MQIAHYPTSASTFFSSNYLALESMKLLIIGILSRWCECLFTILTLPERTHIKKYMQYIIKMHPISKRPISLIQTIADISW